MARILRAKSISSPKTPRGVRASSVDKAWHDPAATQRVTTRQRVRRLFVRDPDNPLFSAVADQFTNNPNPNFDPSKGSGSVKRLDSTPTPPRGSTSGHQKVVRPQSEGLGGKLRLRRR